jgi:Ser/Thr protein kinase RdoA (MazF antagonist)
MSETPYQGLTPDLILNSLESIGLRPTGHLFALNSYENRVYQIGIETDSDEMFYVAKYYRPSRWNSSQILEEHSFAEELFENEIPVIPPLRLLDKTLFEFGDFYFALFEKSGGRAPELEDRETLQWIGRFIGRIHAVGSVRSFRYRTTLTPDVFGRSAANFLISNNFIPPELKKIYAELVDLALDLIDMNFKRVKGLRTQRILGDCHPGNILWRVDDGPRFVDLDDSMMGPAVQDLWMMLSGDEELATQQLDWLLSGYEDFTAFDRSELILVEPLRTMRIIYYAGWLARRWGDPAFGHAFPWFNTQAYWEQHIGHLREQVGLLQENSWL